MHLDWTYTHYIARPWGGVESLWQLVVARHQAIVINAHSPTIPTAVVCGRAQLFLLLQTQPQPDQTQREEGGKSTGIPQAKPLAVSLSIGIS